MPKLSIIVAAEKETGGIGKNGRLPWHLKGDMDFFKTLTSGISNAKGSEGEKTSADHINAVIMGRKTWDSIPPRFRPLHNRLNVILTRNPDRFHVVVQNGVIVAGSLDEAYSYLNSDDVFFNGRKVFIDEIFCIGGGQIYQQAMSSEYCSHIYRTMVTVPELNGAEFDTFFPNISETFVKVSDKEADEILEFALPRKRSEENIQYEFQVFRRKST